MLKSIAKAINIDSRFVPFANFSTKVKKLKRQTAMEALKMAKIVTGLYLLLQITCLVVNRGRNTFPDCFSIPSNEH